MNQNPEKTKEGGTGAAEEKSMPDGVIRVDEEMIRSHLDKVVVSTVEQTLNAMRNAETAPRYCAKPDATSTRTSALTRGPVIMSGAITRRRAR
ncbi:MAG: hypothetical protein LBG65_04935 [Puniceicoccales bacterium]|jgi:hypothetical protein|nr:hypothetical protein [Puniceicoccales bacterium]